MTLRSVFRGLALAAMAAATLSLSACGGGGYTRGVFQGYVLGKTEAEIVDQVGQPAEVDRSNPDRPLLLYKEKTFDPDNSNRIDPVTVVYLRKREDGKVVADDLGFRG